MRDPTVDGRNLAILCIPYTLEITAYAQVLQDVLQPPLGLGVLTSRFLRKMDGV